MYYIDSLSVIFVLFLAFCKYKGSKHLKPRLTVNYSKHIRKEMKTSTGSKFNFISLLQCSLYWHHEQVNKNGRKEKKKGRKNSKFFVN